MPGQDTITIQVDREAVCAADDQLNPLVLEVTLSADATLDMLIEAVLQEDFLQFSSTHTVIAGRAAGVELLRVRSRLIGKRVSYRVPAETALRACVPEGRLTFVWPRP